jgi:integrase
MRKREKSLVRSLKPREWPLADQLAWNEVRRADGRLTLGGRAAHLSITTQDDLASRYGLFLDHVRRVSGKLDAIGAPAPYVMSEHVYSYIAELRKRVSSVTLHGTIAKLRRMAELLKSDADFDWLSEIENDLALDMIPASKFDRIIETDRIVLAGLALMEEAKNTITRTRLQRAQNYRNGLMIALLGMCPIRLKNFSSLTIGKNFVKIGEGWCIALIAKETKERRADERQVPTLLTRYIDTYLKTYRPTFGDFGQQIWLGRDGALTYHGVERIITDTTRMTLGISISPHLFRSCAASTAYMHGNDFPHLATALLNHRGSTTTQEHYVRSRSSFYCEEYRKLLDNV